MLRSHRKVFAYSWPQGLRARRKAKRFLRRAIRDCSYDLRRAPIHVTIRFTRSNRFVFLYDHGTRSIEIPVALLDGDWETWVPTLIHEWGHALDFQTLTAPMRDRFFEHATALSANWHYDFHGERVPAHMVLDYRGKPVQREASWLFDDWADNVAETWADTFQAAFSPYPFSNERHTYRVNEALKTMCKEMLP